MQDATLGDEVIAVAGEGGYWFERIVESSLNSLVRVAFFDATHRERVSQDLAALGCSSEFLDAYSLLAVNIPQQAALGAVQRYLEGEAAADRLDYEEPILRQ